MKKKILIILIICAVVLSAQQCLAKRVIIPTTAKVASFGTYSYAGRLECEIKQPGEQLVGTITVEGAYNGEYPWIMRIYTDNAGYAGIAGAAKRSNPAGLVSTDARFVIPLLLNVPNMGPSRYKEIPDINHPGYKTYVPDRLDEPPQHTECIIMAIDPRNEAWVAGDNGVLFDRDDNTLGDTTVPTPFDLKFRANFDEAAVAANYTANLYIELIACP